MFREAAQVLLMLLRCISMKRAIAVSESDSLNFFRLFDFCLMDEAVLSWCKLFGNRRTEKLHWTRLFPETTTVHADLQRRLDLMSGGSLESLSSEILTYRDKYVAHHDLDEAIRPASHPKLSPLHETGQELYREIYNSLNSLGCAEGLPSPDEITGQSLVSIEAHWKKIADAARSATKAFREQA